MTCKITALSGCRLSYIFKIHLFLAGLKKFSPISASAAASRASKFEWSAGKDYAIGALLIFLYDLCRNGMLHKQLAISES